MTPAGPARSAPDPPRVGPILLLPAGLTALSWVRWLLARDLSPDRGVLPVPLGVLALAVLTALVLAALHAHRTLVAAAPPPDRVLPWAVGAALLAAPMLPLLSNDLFSLLAYVDLAWTTEVSPFAMPPWGLLASRFHPLVSPVWRTAPCVWGPLQLVAWAPALAGGGPLAAVLLAKLPALAATLVVVGGLRAYLRARPGTGAAFAFAALHPVLLVEGAGQAHSDLIAAACLALWLVAGGAGRVALAGALLGLAVSAKVTSLVPAGMYLVFLLGRPGPLWPRLRATLLAGGAMAAAVVACYAPFWDGPATLTRPLGFLSWKWPVNTWSEVLFRLWQLDADRPVWVVVRALADVSTRLTAVLALAGIVASWRAADFPQLVARAAMALALAVTALATSFQPWYLLPCVVLGVEVGHPAWRAFLLVSATLALLVDGACLLEQPGVVHEAWRLITLSMVCVLWALGLQGRVRALWKEP